MTQNESCTVCREEKDSFMPPLISLVKAQDERGLWDNKKKLLRTRAVNLLNLWDDGALINSDTRYEKNLPIELWFKLPGKKCWECRSAAVVSFEDDEAGSRYRIELKFNKNGSAEVENRGIPEAEDVMSPADIEFLMATRLIGAMPDESMSVLINCFTPFSVEENERFITQGDVGDALYLIEKGTCSVLIEKDGKEHKLARLGAGDVVGEMALFTGEPRSTHVVADTPMKMWRLNKEDFDNIIHEFPDLRYFLTEIVTQRLDSSSHTAERRIDKYIIKNKLGKGGWSIVYQGVHHRLNMPVAIKMMRHDMAMEEEFQESFKYEAEIIARLNHKNIVKVYDIQELYRTIFIIMEYLDGTALKEYLKQQGTLPEDETLKILMEVLSGLEYAHQNGIIHRDIKPANIFLESSGLVKILDFGLACPPGTEDMNMKGTVNYMPPEQIDGDAVSPMADIYSLGIMAFEMLAGERPYPEDDLIALMDLHCEEEIPEPSSRIPGLTPQLGDFIKKCCRIDPGERYQSAAEALEALQKIADALHVQSSVKEQRHMTSIFAFYDSAGKEALRSLLEEFCEKAQSCGIETRISEFKDI